jgi:hypothetical protein
MARRRLPKEQPFGFDAFVDLVTNLVGIVLRLILVVMMGAHLHGLEGKSASEETAEAGGSSPGIDTESPVLSAELEKQQAEVARLQARLLETLKAMDVAAADLDKSARTKADRQHMAEATAKTAATSREAFSSQELAVGKLDQDRRSLQQRLVELEKSMREIEQKPPDKRLLRFHHPLSRPVSSGELIFELRGGRVTFIDLQAFLDEVKETLPRKVEVLRKQWEIEDSTDPVGAFRMRYVVARERTAMDRAAGGLAPGEERGFSYGLDRWELEPVLAVRGETLTEALADGSRFRQVVDGTDADQVVLTFFVYADSFELFRELRDRLYERGFMVAGRPLDLGRSIAGSRYGTVSRGQ